MRTLDAFLNVLGDLVQYCMLMVSGIVGMWSRGGAGLILRSAYSVTPLHLIWEACMAL